MRRTREGLGLALLDVVLRELWIQAQTDAMTRGVGFEDALLALEEAERQQMYEED